MKEFHLGWFLKRKEPTAVIAALSRELDGGVRILDAQGGALADYLPAANGSPDGDGRRQPILYQDEVIGWVVGQNGGTALAGLVAHLYGLEVERRRLADEVLERYRELSQLYHLAERLVVSPEEEAIARLALEQAGRLVYMDAGLVMLVNEQGELCMEFAAPGEWRLPSAASPQAELLRQALEQGKAQVMNQAGIPFPGQGEAPWSFLCAPLVTEKRTVGALLLACAGPRQYLASDLMLLNMVAQQVAPAIEMARLYQVAVEKGRMEREMQMGRQVQAGLLPQRLPNLPGWDIAASWQPAREVSGDYYDLIYQKDGCLGLVIADVADKGLPAALFMVNTRSVLRAALDQAGTPAAHLGRVNRLIAREGGESTFVTLFYAQLNPASGQVTYVNAGHNPPLLLPAGGREAAWLKRTSMALGLFPGMPVKQDELRLEEGDLLVMYTDGVTEASNAAGDEFGVEQLEQIVRQHASAPAQEIVAALEAAVNQFTDGVLKDDTTLLVVRRN